MSAPRLGWGFENYGTRDRRRAACPNRSVLAIIPRLREVKGNRYAQRRLRSRPQVIRPHVKMVDAGRGDWGLAL